MQIVKIWPVDGRLVLVLKEPVLNYLKVLLVELSMQE
jgi:hypothetical protein